MDSTVLQSCLWHVLESVCVFWFFLGPLTFLTPQPSRWIAVDYKLFTPGQKVLQPNTVAIVEEIPGLAVSQDMSAWVSENRTWQSYNIPYFPSVYHLTAYDVMEETKGPYWYSWTKHFRRIIFDRESPQIQVGDFFPPESFFRVFFFLHRWSHFFAHPLILPHTEPHLHATYDALQPMAHRSRVAHERREFHLCSR